MSTQSLTCRQCRVRSKREEWVLAQGTCPRCGYEQPNAPRPREVTDEQEAMRRAWLRGQSTPDPVQRRQRDAGQRAEVEEARRREDAEEQTRVARTCWTGFTLVCVATAAATWSVMLYNRDPYSDDPIFISSLAIAFLVGPVALGVLLSAMRQIGRSLSPVPSRYHTLAIGGFLLALVGAAGACYLVLMGMVSNLTF